MSTRWSRRLGIVLLLSLALNLFLGGVIVSQWMFEPASIIDDRGPRFINRRAGLDALDPENREKVEAIWRADRREFRAAWRAMRKSRRSVKAALTSEPFDREAFDSAHLELTTHVDRIRYLMSERLAKISAVLPPDERQQYFEAAFDRRDRRPPRRRHRAGENAEDLRHSPAQRQRE